MKAAFSCVMRSLAEFVYPRRCCVCGTFYNHDKAVFGLPTDPAPPASLSQEDPPFAAIMAPFMCAECAAAFTPLSGPLCVCCGQMFASAEAEDHLCSECRRFPGAFNTARAVGVYDRSLSAAVQKLKYNGWTGLAAPLGTLLWLGVMKWYGPFGIDIITPVPLHPAKFRQRGFNQSYLLIRQWRYLKKQGKIELPSTQIKRSLLFRIRRTRSQTRLSRKKRRENVKGAIALREPVHVRGRRILLVDDVYTTGATVNECARVLKAAGAGRVDVLTLARAQ